MAQYLKQTRSARTPQSESILGENQVENSAGGYVYQVDCWTRMERFLVLGSEGGSYYTTEPKLTRENAENVLKCIKEDGVKTVAKIVEISNAGRAPRQSPGLYALALAADFGDEATKHAAYLAVPLVCRTGSTLMEWVQYTGETWPMGKRKAIARWFRGWRPRDLAYQVVKYRERNGWSNWDLLRSAHPWPRDGKAEPGVQGTSLQMTYNGLIMGWVAGKVPLEEGEYTWHPEVRDFLRAYEQLQKTTDPDGAAALIRAHRLPREAVPTRLLQSAEVWAALLDDMPVLATVRNLATLTRRGVLTPFTGANIEKIEKRLESENLRKARVHPLQILGALLTYKSGEGVRGSGVWEPVPKVVDALDKAFYDAFGAVEPTGKRVLIGIDGSGSMEHGEVAGIPGLSPRLGAVALALVTANVESSYQIVGYTCEGRTQPGPGTETPTTKGVKPVAITPRMRLDAAMAEFAKVVVPEGTDCALPVIYATERNYPIDLFVNLTDNETWAGPVHPSQALREHRKKFNVRSKLVVCAMEATEFSICDQEDRDQMDVVGFDLNVPSVIGEFARG